MNKSIINNEQDNDWANNLEGTPIHISQAESGAKGYYCLGCDKEMQAVKRKIAHYQSYFRHHVKDVDNSKVECVHASREYREKLAFFYFMRTKQITVPAVYKYPPKGVDGQPYLVQEKQTIIAHRVDKEVTIFEDEEGNIHWNNKEKIDDRFLWIRPDAVFYDKDDKPILLLEFVVTHKPDRDKLNKLQRLGINTVQIIVPKLSETELEKEISKPSKVKWTYNEIESNTEYIPVSKGNSEGVPSIDDIQRKLFEESFACRRAQVENLIRTINRCLESQSYRGTEQLFEQEIQRIEKATREHQSRLDEIQEGIENEIYSELGNRREEFDKRKEEFRKYSSSLEQRYNTKKSEIRAEEEHTDREIEFRHNIGESKDEINREFERKRRELEFEETDIDATREVFTREEESIVRFIEENRAIEESYAGGKESIRAEFEALEKSEQERFEQLRNELESKIKTFGELKAEIEVGIRSDIEGEYKQIIERVSDRDVQGGDELSQRIKSILELRGLFDSYANGKTTLERYRKGIQTIKNGTWKEWN